MSRVIWWNEFGQNNTEVLGHKNFPQFLSAHHKSHLNSAGIEPGHPRLKAHWLKTNKKKIETVYL